MRVRLITLLALVALLGGAAIGSAQQPGQIFGRVTDTSGAVLPGVTVTLTSPVLLTAQTAVTSATGTYQFPQLPIGVYTVRFELTGFKAYIREGIRIEIGFNAQVNATLDISAVQETVTVTGESPVIDLRDTSKTARFTQETLQSIPSARDPWVIIEQSPSVAMDRQNVGGSASGQQSNFVARGAAFSQQKWNLDGVDITDMSATGGSPVYFDFDAFEEMQITTGGSDVTMQSPGVGVNLVTKSGTDRFRGSGRYYITDQALQSQNVTDEIRAQGASSGNPIQNINDYGIEAGGPIKKGRAWWWASYGKQNIDVGINNFFKTDTTECAAIATAYKASGNNAASLLPYSVDTLNNCLNTDNTLLNNYNAKVAVELFKNNQFSMFFNAAEKVRNARDASDLRPIETTYRQIGVDRPDLGSSWWKTGMPKSYKWADRHIFSDRFMMEFSYAHVGNNFALTFHEDGLRDVQPMYDIATGAWARSYTESVYVRPTDSVDITGNYFLPGVLGGDHSLKFGFKYRNDIAHSESHWGGNAYGRFASFASGQALEAQIYRDGLTEYGLHNRSFYVQDSYNRRKLTINLGIRFDYQTDYANAEQVPATPFYGQATFSGVYVAPSSSYNAYRGTYSGAIFDQLPELNFPGAEALGTEGHAFTNWSPRVGLTYDITGDGRNVAKFNYSRYVGQIGTGDMSSTYTTTGSSLVRYPWVDVNGDQTVQANEIVLTTATHLDNNGKPSTQAPLSWSSIYDYKNPGSPVTSGTNDPNLTGDYADEIIVGFDRQLGREFAVGAAYIWRQYSNFRWSPIPNWSSANYEAVPYTPPASGAGSCPSGARCETITYYQPTSQIPTGFYYTNRPDYSRAYQGIELTARKRMSKNWMLNGGFSWNTAPQYYDSAASYQDPTNIDMLNKAQYAPESTSSGLGNVFVNAKWLFKVSGAYTLPWYQIGVAAFYNARSGFPFLATIQTPSRPFSAGRADVYLDPIGDNRLPTFQTMDFRLDKPFTLPRGIKIMASMDIFNLFNGNTALSIRGRQNTQTATSPGNANQISSILAPRVLRFGFRVTW